MWQRRRTRIMCKRGRGRGSTFRGGRSVAAVFLLLPKSSRLPASEADRWNIDGGPRQPVCRSQPRASKKGSFVALYFRGLLRLVSFGGFLCRFSCLRLSYVEFLYVPLPCIIIAFHISASLEFLYVALPCFHLSCSQGFFYLALTCLYSFTCLLTWNSLTFLYNALSIYISFLLWIP